MTPLDRTVRRRSKGFGVNRRSFVVSLEVGDLIGFRDLRRRKTYYLPLATCYALAVKAEVAQRKAEKAKATKAPRRRR